jgi:hypothetical protein
MTLVSSVRLFGNLFFLVQSSRFAALRCSFLDTPATASCKDKLLIALHNLLLIVLLDLWQQNVFLLLKKCDWRVLQL